MDLPTYLEANYIATFVIKLVWVCCYILVYGIRPVVIRPKKVGESQTPFHLFLWLAIMHSEQFRRWRLWDVTLLLSVRWKCPVY